MQRFLIDFSALEVISIVLTLYKVTFFLACLPYVGRCVNIIQSGLAQNQTDNTPV